MSEAYGSFAAVYDAFMAGTDYRGWVEYTDALIRRHGGSPGLLLDLGCGTGSATVLFKELGYDTIGLDMSPEMLAGARVKDPGGLYINQDMRSFELYGTVDAIVSLCDSMNYILCEDDLAKVFALVQNYLNPGGLFVFDMNTAYKYGRIGNRAMMREADGDVIMWDNRWYPDDSVNRCNLHMFKREGPVYRRFGETHVQRAYGGRVIEDAVTASGLEFAGAYACKTFREPGEKAPRVFYAARKGAGKKVIL